jgi:hypothetical protein
MLKYIQRLVIAIILGGMAAFQVLFAPLIFIKLPSNVARPFIRKFFPFYYLYFGILSIALVVIAYMLLGQDFGLWLLVVYTASTVGFIFLRQVFMPLANKSTDEVKQADFLCRRIINEQADLTQLDEYSLMWRQKTYTFSF